jgi:hypothetical protein
LPPVLFFDPELFFAARFLVAPPFFAAFLVDAFVVSSLLTPILAVFLAAFLVDFLAVGRFLVAFFAAFLLVFLAAFLVLRFRGARRGGAAVSEGITAADSSTSWAAFCSGGVPGIN